MVGRHQPVVLVSEKLLMDVAWAPDERLPPRTAFVSREQRHLQSDPFQLLREATYLIRPGAPPCPVQACLLWLRS
jgi:hypothetical protein